MSDCSAAIGFFESVKNQGRRRLEYFAPAWKLRHDQLHQVG